jgi:hypothetical protein
VVCGFDRSLGLAVGKKCEMEGVSNGEIRGFGSGYMGASIGGIEIHAVDFGIGFEKGAEVTVEAGRVDVNDLDIPVKMHEFGLSDEHSVIQRGVLTAKGGRYQGGHSFRVKNDTIEDILDSFGVGDGCGHVEAMGIYFLVIRVCCH